MYIYELLHYSYLRIRAPNTCPSRLYISNAVQLNISKERTTIKKKLHSPPWLYL